MADDITPGEASVLRGGPQMNIREARAVADEAGTVRGEAPTNTADRDVLTGADARPGAYDEPAARGSGGRIERQSRPERVQRDALHEDRLPKVGTRVLAQQEIPHRHSWRARDAHVRRTRDHRGDTPLTPGRELPT